ncbi:MAG: ATP-binding protein [Helicobacter sp.]|uniref:ATP-binding protein n=1 Tax=Helicobacter sp. TaxID=218 RepID=UPI002585DB58|nr:ATP-binding protein [Helicobacter sp.]MCI7764814.1 ATP-binding protein [Helicobacter sp.]MDY4425947.1 ATP-binding protein [Helicobacter sp.]
MQYLLDFLQTTPITKTKIYPFLRCSEEEALILRYYCKEILKGNEEILCLDTINALFVPNSDEAILKFLPLFKNLLDLGWLSQNLFLKNLNNEVLYLKLLNSTFSLSNNFLKLIQEGGIYPKLPKISAYSDHLDYLKDQFLVIDILSSLLPYKKDNLSSPFLAKGEQKIKALQDRIKQRLNLTKEKPNLEKIFEEYSLSDQEKIIFLALLKEEYSGRESQARELNALINLVSLNDYERIKNRALLDDRSKLVQKGLVDYDEILSTFEGINRTFFIPDEILKKITHPSNESKKQKISLEALIDNQDIFEFIQPKTTLNNVVLNPRTKETLETLLKQMDSKVLQNLKNWGIKDKKRGIDAKIIFYGAAGTGKTMTALALAKSLKKSILSFDCSKILSMYVGESEKNVRKIFDTYKELCKESKESPILLLDEADQFLSMRSTSANSADKMHNQMQNIFLEQIEKFNGILIATTNLLETIDTAFSRRFNYKIEFKKPNLEERLLLWEKLLPKNAPYEKTFNLKSLAEFSLTGGQIFLVIKNTAFLVATQKSPLFTTQIFIEEIKRELNSNFDGQREMGFHI